MPQSDQSREGGGAPGDGSAPPPPPPPASRDERPKPKYGEYAPEGWNWQPPEQTTHEDPPQAPATTQAPAAPAAPAGSAPTARLWDRPITLGLLVFGIIGVSLAVSIQQTLPDAMSLLHTQEGIDPYVPADAVAGIISTGMIAQIVLWVLTALIAIVRLIRRRVAFWVPLAGAALSFVVLFGVVWAVLATDPVLVEHFGTVGVGG
ncbi:DUF6264 family protein [Agromyces sp. SYSU T00194]|uniref:DUF6264 family protein n=1 Tax=Agromyces chitinivorans TaxID=3158560 RepID=UPI00339590AF